MGTSKKAEGKRSLREMAEEDVIEDDQEEEGREQRDQCGFLGFTAWEREESAVEKKRRGKKTTAEARGGGGGVCQIENCATNMTGAKPYHRRHKVCEFHAKAASVSISGRRQRFCQQCSRFHELGEFDEAKRSCRRRLAGHNERRRKSSVDFQGGESSSRTENS